MSLVKFAMRNHPTQVHGRGVADAVDDRMTPRLLFAPLDELYGFTIDVAASEANAKCERFYTLEDDGIIQSWAGERVWCNPPYSIIRPWVEKAWTSDADLVVMLLPANRTEQRWWQDLVEPYRDRPGSPLTVEFLRGRTEFARPDNSTTHVPFGCCLLRWGCAAPVIELARQASLDFGGSVSPTETRLDEQSEPGERV